MHLDVNFCQINQENYYNSDSSTFCHEMFKANGDSFQNTPVHLLFYEKISTQEMLVPSLDPMPELFSMSWCRFKKNAMSNMNKLAYDVSLLMVIEGLTGQFVTREKYLQLMFILGQKIINPGNDQDYKELLTLLNNFNTSTPENFKALISKLEFPFIYDEQKIIFQNRCDFKDFFLV